MGEVHCDADGRFELALPAGDYVLRPRRGQNVVSFTIEAKVIGGRTRPATIAIQPLNDVTVLGAEALAALHAFEHALEDRDKDKVWALLQAHPTLAQGRSAHGSLLAPAASHGWLDVCALMLDHSAAEVDKAPGAATALHQAAWHGHLEVVKLLIARGLPVDPVENEYGGTPLGWAIHGAHHSGSNGDYVGIAQALLEAGAKPTGLDMTQGPDDPFYKLLVAHGAK